MGPSSRRDGVQQNRCRWTSDTACENVDVVTGTLPVSLVYIRSVWAQLTWVPCSFWESVTKFTAQWRCRRHHWNNVYSPFENEGNVRFAIIYWDVKLATLSQKLGIEMKIRIPDKAHKWPYLQRSSKAAEVFTGCTIGTPSVVLNNISVWSTLQVLHCGVMVGSNLTLGSRNLAKSRNDSAKALSKSVLLYGGPPVWLYEKWERSNRWFMRKGTNDGK